ncbi:hypothetical protein [Pseudanabaena minima]|uniref:hypothetical protein n=1 Tax=Pseudanabaena minima TaxID=890415 RepID=UPI003DA8E237
MSTAKRKGKRSDPTYDQVGAYVPKELYKDVKEKLVREDRDFSDLVTDLLSEWTKNGAQHTYNSTVR